MKKLIYIILLIALFFPIKLVNASDINHGYSQQYYDSCVNKHTCLLLCGYENKVQTTASWVTPAQYDYFSSYAYYYFDTKKMMITWISQEKDLDLATHTYETYHKYIFWQSGILNKLANSGVCPTHSYIDVSGFGVASELCFDNNGTYCVKDDPGGIGTTFKGSSTKEYDYGSQIDIYFNNWAPKIKDCNELRSKTFNIVTTLETDFRTNFLYGNNIPNFIKNSDKYKNGMESLKKKYTDLRDQCNAEAEEQYKNNQITKEEKDTLVEQNNAGLEEAEKQVDDAQKDISKLPEVTVGTSKPLNCDDFTYKDIDESGNVVGTRNFLKEIFNIMMIAGPILLIIFGTIDFAKASLSSDEAALKKAGTNFAKRLIATILLFLLPLIVGLIIDVAYDAGVFGDTRPALCVDETE